MSEEMQMMMAMMKQQQELNAQMQTQMQAEMQLQREQMQAQMTAQAEAQKEQMKLMEALLRNSGTRGGGGDADETLPIGKDSPAKLMAELDQRLVQFQFDAENDRTFSRWYDRYQDIFVVDGASLDEKARVRLLLGKLDEVAYGQYQRQILPEVPGDRSFDNTVKTLREMFDVRTSIFTRRYHCLKIEKSDLEDFREYTGRVNEQCENAQLEKLDKEGVKALLWIYGLKSSNDSEVRRKALEYLDREHNESRKVQLHDLFKESDKWLTLKRDARLVEAAPQTVYKVDSRPQRAHTGRVLECWNCGSEGHKSMDCSAKRSKCRECGKRGHREKYCTRLNRRRSDDSESEDDRHVGRVVVVGASPARMAQFEANRIHVEVNVNGTSVRMQYDTGSDISLLSETQWKAMGRPKLEYTSCVIRDAGGGRMKIKGRMKCLFVVGEEHGVGYVYITSSACLLGLEWIHQLKQLQFRSQVVPAPQNEPLTTMAETSQLCSSEVTLSKSVKNCVAIERLCTERQCENKSTLSDGRKCEEHSRKKKFVSGGRNETSVGSSVANSQSKKASRSHRRRLVGRFPKRHSNSKRELRSVELADDKYPSVLVVPKTSGLVDVIEDSGGRGRVHRRFKDNNNNGIWDR